MTSPKKEARSNPLEIDFRKEETRPTCPPTDLPTVSFSTLRIAPFRALWLGQAISQLGDAFYYIAFMFMVQKVTGSSVMVGYVGALEALPFLLLGSYAGVVVDRLDRRRIMLLSDLCSGLALVGLAACIWLQRQPPVWALLVTPFVLSSVRCFFMPAKSASIPSL